MTVDSTLAIPLKQTAIIQDYDGTPKLAHDVAVPRLEPGTVLVKTVAVALNPADYKMGAAFPTPGSVVGMDYAGVIVAIHPETSTDLRIGEPICGMVHGSNPASPDNGAFAGYIRVRPEMALRVPQWEGEKTKNHLPMEQAATLGVGIMTNIMALWDASGLALTADPAEPAAKPFPVLVYGASTATGTLATQLLRLSGLCPVATCSPRNFGLVRARGAAQALDIGSADVVSDIKSFAAGKLKHVFDCIGDTHSATHCYAAIRRTGGKYVMLEQVQEEVLNTRLAVRANLALGYELLGREVPFPKGYGCAANPDTVPLAQRYLHILQGLLDRGALMTHPVQILDGKLPSILEGLKLLKSGSVSGKKLVVFL